MILEMMLPIKEAMVYNACSFWFIRPISVVNCKTGSAPVKANALIKPGSEGAQNMVLSRLV